MRSTRSKNGKPCIEACVECSLAATWRRRATRHVSTVVGNSRFVLDLHLREGYFAAAAQRAVVYNAYSPDPTITVSSSKPRGAGLHIGYLGRLHPTKGVELLIDAFADAGIEHSRLSIAGVGERGYAASLTRRCKEADISFRGFVEPGAFLDELDLLVVPSIWDEPLPRAVYEAFAHGVAVLASTRGGTPEIVNNEVDGLLFEPHAQELSALLRRCAGDTELIERLQKQARESAKQFLPSRTAASYVDVYRSTLGTSPS